MFFLQKSSGDVIHDNLSLSKIAAVLNAPVLTGSISSVGDASQLALSYNNGEKTIVIQKLEVTDYPFEVNSVSAQIIISNYGIFVNDPRHNKRFLFANNDPESIDKFRQVKALAAGTEVVLPVFGTTIINAEKL